MPPATASLLPEPLLDQVLIRLGLSTAPEVSLDGLRLLYGAWCLQVPFDNVQKLVHLHQHRPGPLPGITAEDFFTSWLKHGTGGTCWAGSNALHALLTTLGFEAVRGIATMLVVPDLPPNHGSVRVTVEGRPWLTDTSILFGEPLPLDAPEETAIPHPAWGVRARITDGLWQVNWRPLHMTDGFPCRFDRFGADPEEYARRYDDTRGWSPFNYQLTARRNRDQETFGMAFGDSVSLRSNGGVEKAPIDDAERRRRLIEDFGMSDEIVSQLPADRPTPPPPGSKTAAQEQG